MYKNEGNVLTALSGNIFIFNTCILGVIAFGNIMIYYYELNFWIRVSKFNLFCKYEEKKNWQKALNVQ